MMHFPGPSTGRTAVAISAYSGATSNATVGAAIRFAPATPFAVASPTPALTMIVDGAVLSLPTCTYSPVCAGQLRYMSLGRCG